MPYGFLDIAVTPSVRAAQAAMGSAHIWQDFEGHRRSTASPKTKPPSSPQRDSFYMATVSETGWPYIQHRGGPPGFLKVLDDTTLAFADYRGNRQYISLGNLAADDRACLFLMDYPAPRAAEDLRRTPRPCALDADPELTARVASPATGPSPSASCRLHLEAFDWNCPQHITPRFTEAEIAEPPRRCATAWPRWRPKTPPCAPAARRHPTESLTWKPNARPLPPFTAGDRRRRRSASPKTPGTPATPHAWRSPTRPTAAGATAPNSSRAARRSSAFLTRKWQPRTRLPPDQGALGLPRQPHRRPLRLRVARRQRQLVPLLRQRELGVRRTRPDAPPPRQHQRRADPRRTTANSTGRRAAGPTTTPRSANSGCSVR